MYSEPNTDCSNGYCPERLLHLVGTQWGSRDPSCPLVGPTVLCSIGFSVQGEVGGYYPMRFFWTDCNSNSFGVFEGNILDTLLVSNQVFDFDGTNITLDQPFPSHTGEPSSCLGSAGPDTLRVSGIDFQNGGIGISYVDSIQTPRAAISIEKTHGTELGMPEYISINLNPYPAQTVDSLEIAAFDFLFAYDPNVATFVSAEPGQLLQNCPWEYFEYRADTLGFVRVIGVANTTNGIANPTCLANSPGELVLLTFQITGDTTYQCQLSPLYWWWNDCGDNTVSGAFGDTLYVSNRILAASWGQSIQNNHEFPSQYGAPTICLVDSFTTSPPIRAIDFYLGGLNIVCIDSIDTRGDVNLNELSFEIADWVLFSNYFIYGPAVFDINYEAQVAATNVNGDSLTLTLWDLMYIYRVIIGDTLPFPTPPKSGIGDTVHLVQDTIARTVSVSYTDSLSALLLYFDGEINSSDSFPNHNFGLFYDSVMTRIMIFPDHWLPPDSALIDSGLLFTYTGNGNLVDALAAYDGLSFLQTSVEGGGLSNCCVTRGNVDGSSGPGIVINIADLVMLVDYMFGPSGIEFSFCPEEANVNGLGGLGGMIDISDMIYLVDYIFRGGAAPPPCSGP